MYMTAKNCIVICLGSSYLLFPASNVLPSIIIKESTFQIIRICFVGRGQYPLILMENSLLP
jgi:hypothetical protein